MVTRSMLAGILEKVGADCRGEMSKAMDAASANIARNMEATIQEYDKVVERRFSTLESDVLAFKRRQEEQEEQLVQTKRQFAELVAAMAVAERVARDGPGPEFDRKIDEGVLRLNTSENVSKEALVEEAVKGLLEEAAIPPEAYKVEGGSLGRNFAVRFGGEPLLAARRVTKVMDLLRRSDGAWRRLEVCSPAGSSVPVFAGRDKNAKTIREESTSKRLARVVEAALAARRQGQEKLAVHHKKREGMVFVDWQRLAKVEATRFTEYTVRWNIELVEKLGLDKQQLLEALAAGGSPSSAGVTWSI